MVNGEVDTSYTIGTVDFGLKIANATALYAPGLFSFRAHTLDPFAGTPLAFVASAGGYDVEATGTTSGSFSATLSATSGSILSFPSSDLEVSLSNTTADV